MVDLYCVIRENIVECCKEIVELDETGILKDGLVRKYIKQYLDDEPNKFKIIKSMVEEVAVRVVAEELKA